MKPDILLFTLDSLISISGHAIGCVQPHGLFEFIDELLARTLSKY